MDIVNRTIGKLGLSYRKLGKLLDVSHVTIWHWKVKNEIPVCYQDSILLFCLENNIKITRKELVNDSI